MTAREVHDTQLALVRSSMGYEEDRTARHGMYSKRHAREDAEAIRLAYLERAERQTKVELRRSLPLAGERLL